MLFVRCYPRETQEMVFDAHDRALVVGLCEGHDDADRNYRQTRMLLGQHPDLAGIYNIGVAAAGVARALKEMNRAHDVVFIGHGLTSDTRSLLMEGTMDAVITQNQLNTMMSCVGIFNNLRGEAEPPCTALRRPAVKSFSVRIFRNSAIDVFDRNGAKVILLAGRR
jgi:ABC-type sugar transport system substrate-binding protein